MPEDKMQIDIDENLSAPGGDLTDDDLAASLGFMTTLSERGLMSQQDPMAEMESEEGEDEAPGKEDMEDTKDGEQDTKLQELEAEITRLEALINNGPQETTVGPEA